MSKTQKNEGEGNRTAARRYNKDTREFVESGKVEKNAEKARQAAAGDEGRAMKQAEKEGLKKARH
jgi:RNA polymerase-interacting CarD/CdnL/TRCF family regulator